MKYPRFMENDFIASIGFVPDSSSLKRIENAISSSVEKGTVRGSQKGLIQGINSNAFTQPLGRITGKANEFEKSMAAANARVIAFGASTAPIFAMAEAFHKLVDSTVEVEKTMTGINAIFELSSSGLRKFTAQLFETANKTGQSFLMASEAATEFARQGLNVEETLQRTSAALILNKISGLNMAEAVSSITSILNGFSKEALNATDIINRMTAVDTQFAVSAADLAEALKRVGASANDANVSFSQTLALITAARQITGREGSVIGNSFKTMFTRLQRPEVLDDLEEAGIQVRELNGRTKPLIEVFKSLASTYQGLAQSQKSFVSEAVGGVYQINILKGIMRDLSSGMSVYDNAVNAADNSTSAVTKRMQTLNSTLSAGLVRTMNDLSLAASGVGEHLFGNSMRSGIGFFDNSFKNIAGGMDKDNTGALAQGAQGAVKGMGNFLVGPGLQMGVNLILKLLVELGKFSVASGKDVLGLDKGMKEKIALEQRFLQILQKEPEIYQRIINQQETIASFSAKAISQSNTENKQHGLAKTMAEIIASKTAGQNLYHGDGLSANGFVPNLSPVQSEMRMAAQGGYIAGRVISTQIQNGNHRLNTIANTNETKSMMMSNGQQYEFVNPPYGSMAGKQHERDSVAKTGINPYSLTQMPLSANGMIPNLAFAMWEKHSGNLLGKYKTSGGAMRAADRYKNHDGDSYRIGSQSGIFTHGTEDEYYSFIQARIANYNKNSISANGFVPNLANLSQEQLRELLKSKKFQSFTYQKADGSMGTYHDSQWGVRKDKLVGAPAPGGFKSWGALDNGTGTLALHTRKAGEEEAKFRRFILANVKQVNANGQTYNLSAQGYVPLLDALSRENKATGGHAQVSFDPRLITNDNPFGFAAIDGRTQRSASHAISQHLSGGQSLGEVKKAHSAKGFVPNLALNGGFDASLLLTVFGSAMQHAENVSSIEKFIGLFPALFDATQKEIISKRKLVMEFDTMNKNILTTGKPQSFYGQSFDSLHQVQQSKLNQKIDEFRGDIKQGDDKRKMSKEGDYKTGFRLATGSSFIGGMASQLAGTFGSPTLGAASEDFTTSLTSAGQALIAFPNKIGKALSIGFFANGILNFVDTFSKGAENLKAATDVQLTQIKTVTENLQSLAQTSNNLNTLYLDAGTSMETIARESKKFSDTLGALSQMKGGQALVSKILTAPNADARQAAIQNSIAQKGKEAETIASLQNLRDLFLPKRFLGMNHVPGLQSDKGFTYSNYFDKDSSKQQLVENASVPLVNMSKDFQDALLASVDSIDTFKTVLNTFKGDGADDIRSYLGEVKNVTGKVGFEQIIQQMRAILTQKSIIERNPEVQRLIKTSRTRSENSQLDVDASVKTQQYMRRLLLNQGGMTSDNILNLRQLGARGNYQSDLSRIAGFESQSSLFGQTHGDRTVAQREYGIGLQKNAIETRNSLNGLNIDTNKTLVNSLIQDFDKVLKTTDLKENITGEKNLGISENKALLVTAINTGLSSVLKGSSGDVISRFSKNGQFDFQAFSKAASMGGSNNPLIQSRVEKYLNSQQSVDILKTLNASSYKQAEILQDFKSKSIEEAQKLTAAIQEADFKRQTNYLGGIQSLLNRDNMRTTMRELQRGIAMMSNPNASPMMKSMGAANVLESFKKMNIPMDMNNPLIKKAFSVGIESGGQTFDKYKGMLLGNIARQSGGGSAEYIGASQALGINSQDAVRAMFNAEFKPEGSKNNGEFVNSNELLKPFNDGLQSATTALIGFPNALNVTVDSLQKATASIDVVRKSNDILIQEVNNNLDKTFKTLFSKYGGISKDIEPTQQRNSASYLQSAIAPLGSLLITALGTWVGNKGLGGISSYLRKNVKTLKNATGEIIGEKPLSIAEQVAQEMQEGSSARGSNGYGGSGFGGGNRLRNPYSNAGWEYNAPKQAKPLGWEYIDSNKVGGIRPQEHTENILDIKENLGDSIAKKNLLEKELDILYTQQNDILTKQKDAIQQELSNAKELLKKDTLTRASKAVKYGNTTGISSIDSIVAHGSFEKVDSKTIYKMLNSAVKTENIPGVRELEAKYNTQMQDLISKNAAQIQQARINLRYNNFQESAFRNQRSFVVQGQNNAIGSSLGKDINSFAQDNRIKQMYAKFVQNSNSPLKAYGDALQPEGGVKMYGLPKFDKNYNLEITEESKKLINRKSLFSRMYSGNTFNSTYTGSGISVPKFESLNSTGNDWDAIKGYSSKNGVFGFGGSAWNGLSKGAKFGRGLGGALGAAGAIFSTAEIAQNLGNKEYGLAGQNAATTALSFINPVIGATSYAGNKLVGSMVDLRSSQRFEEGQQISNKGYEFKFRDAVRKGLAPGASQEDKDAAFNANRQLMLRSGSSKVIENSMGIFGGHWKSSILHPFTNTWQSYQGMEANKDAYNLPYVRAQAVRAAQTSKIDNQKIEDAHANYIGGMVYRRIDSLKDDTSLIQKNLRNGGTGLDSMTQPQLKNLYYGWQQLHPNQQIKKGELLEFGQSLHTDSGYQNANKGFTNLFKNTIIPHNQMTESEKNTEPQKLMEQNQKLIDSLDLLRESFTTKNDDKNPSNTKIDFSTLPISITIASANDIGKSALDGITSSLQDLKQRMALLDGNNRPAEVK